MQRGDFSRCGDTGSLGCGSVLDDHHVGPLDEQQNVID